MNECEAADRIFCDLIHRRKLVCFPDMQGRLRICIWVGREQASEADLDAVSHILMMHTYVSKTIH